LRIAGQRQALKVKGTEYKQTTRGRGGHPTGHPSDRGSEAAPRRCFFLPAAAACSGEIHACDALQDDLEWAGMGARPAPPLLHLPALPADSPRGPSGPSTRQHADTPQGAGTCTRRIITHPAARMRRQWLCSAGPNGSPRDAALARDLARSAAVASIWRPPLTSQSAGRAYCCPRPPAPPPWGSCPGRAGRGRSPAQRGAAADAPHGAGRQA